MMFHEIASYLYFFSPMVMIHGIGIGQIDCIGILFFLLSVRMLIEKKYWKMAVAMGIALLSKFFMVFVYVPLFLLNFDKIKKIFKYVAVVIMIPVMDTLITNLLIKDYSLQADVHNEDSFIPRLFNVTLGYDSVVLMIIFVFVRIVFIDWKPNKREIPLLFYVSNYYVLGFLFLGFRASTMVCLHITIITSYGMF